jgi:hypothetical protein
MFSPGTGTWPASPTYIPVTYVRGTVQGMRLYGVEVGESSLSFDLSLYTSPSPRD